MLTATLEWTHTNVILRLLFPITLFISASLLFVVQPMAAKVLLPIFGGTPAVWTICMLFFQGILLLAYSYAWLLSHLKGSRRWRIAHITIALISLLALPVGLSPTQTHATPEWSILSLLLIQLGLPILVIAASAPLLQYAFSQTSNKKAADPYFLYAASNTGSLLALLSYPWLIERFLTLSQQFHLWNNLYFIYLMLLSVLLIAGRYKQPTSTHALPEQVNWQQKATWVLYSFIPCSLLLGATFYISTDVAATPLFWVIPLALYLITFIITFASKPIISHEWVSRNVPFFLIFPIIAYMSGLARIHIIALITYSLAGLFLTALFFHGQLVRTRPATSRLTTFYFCISLGGLLAGLFNGLIAPRIFLHTSEYPLILFLALLCTPIKQQTRGWLTPVLTLALLLSNLFLATHLKTHWIIENHILPITTFALIVIWPRTRVSMFISLAILFLFLSPSTLKFEKTLTQQRNFFGIKTVSKLQNTHYFISHSTIHGLQIQKGPDKTNGTVAYYAPVQSVINQLTQPIHALVLGLGTGTIACQLKTNDKITFVEIDNQVINIAANPKLFTYLKHCKPDISVIENDGLIATEQMADNQFNLIVLDAFSSDAIPTHLLTLEAFQTYQKKLSPNGAILINISNRHLNILPVITAVAHYSEMILLHKYADGDEKQGQLSSNWALLSMNEQLATQLISKADWKFVTDNEQVLWTNDYSNLVPLLK